MGASLQQLAELYGVETTYEDATGQTRQTTREALLRVLQVLGAPLTNLDDVADAERYRRQEIWRRVLEPVTVAWDGQLTHLVVRLPVHSAHRALSFHLEMENGGTHSWQAPWEELPLLDSAQVEGARYEARQLSRGLPLPLGYHRLTLHLHPTNHQCLIVAAPTRAHGPTKIKKSPTWGVFIPLYALHSQRSWGGGDFADLRDLLEWVRQQGGTTVGTLPLLAAFLDEPFEPSPYAAASRLFWNEIFLDVGSIPEWQRCAEARAIANSPGFQHELNALRKAPLVNYRGQMALKRRVLAELSHAFFIEPRDRLASFRRFVEAHPQVEDYARFRAVGERQRSSWWVWPEPLRTGTLSAADYDEGARRYHLYVQWLADEQLRALAEQAPSRGTGLCLDLPLGVHSDSYDVWRERGSFALGVAGGAPPDPFFTKGQDWGFPPLHPDRSRAHGHRYFIACLRHHLQFASLLRIDHMMGLHRLFWVPNGMAARDGVYVRYPADELYALFTLESQRHGAGLVGEDLGTVPEAVRPAMARHGMRRTHVVQYELTSRPQPELPPVPEHAVASVNTHDMPTFAAFWEGLDIEDRRSLGLFDEQGAEQEVRRRQRTCEAVIRILQGEGILQEPADVQAVLRALLRHLCRGCDRLVLVSLEDLWLEKEPQNVPGTWRERPNWRRKAAYPMEAWIHLPQVLETLQEVDRSVRGQGP
jgi:4-alpha-glucanotransferase